MTIYLTTNFIFNFSQRQRFMNYWPGYLDHSKTEKYFEYRTKKAKKQCYVFCGSTLNGSCQIKSHIIHYLPVTFTKAIEKKKEEEKSIWSRYWLAQAFKNSIFTLEVLLKELPVDGLVSCTLFPEIRKRVKGTKMR